MELPTKLLEKIVYNTRSRIEEHILIVMNKSIHEEHLSVPLQINNRQFKIAVTFHACYNVYLISQIKILNFISLNQFQMKTILK